MTERNLFLRILKTPTLMTGLDINQWNRLLYQAHMLKLRGRLAADARSGGLWQKLPDKIQQILTSAEIDTQARQRKILWETNRIRRALFGFDGRVILLKGGGYLARGLACARGRICADIDILVARKNLDIVENALFIAGYGSQVLNEYDQKYYRQWAHELPPLRHPDRMVEVDVHHNIVQMTSKFSVDIGLMISDAILLEDNIYTLSPEDMLLHSFVHLFVDGTIKASLRNLLEQHDMIAEFSGDPGFWPGFIARAEELNLLRPVFYGLHYCQYFFDSPIPDEIMVRVGKAAPNRVTLKVMDMMVARVMIAYGDDRSKLTDYLATNGLYIRSHWLRMPFMMLVRHLAVKSLRRYGLGKS